MFARFIDGGFDYDEISKHPDYPAYASAELLIILLPKIIEEMLRRRDTVNYLIYPMISAIDPQASKQDIYRNRANAIIELADKSFSQSICRFLEAISEDPPNSSEQVQRLLTLWQAKSEVE